MSQSEKSYALIQHMLSELESPYKPLSQWETQFIESITDWFNRAGTLSDKQFAILERIYTEKTA